MISYPIKHPLDDGSKKWAKRNIEEMFPTFSDNLFISNDIIYSKRLNVFKGRRILLIGGGPTGGRSASYANYDDLWTVNNFFKCKIRTWEKIGLAMFGANTVLTHHNLMDVIKTYKPFLVFEPHPKYGNVKTEGHKSNPDWEISKRWINSIQFAPSETKCVCQTAFWARIGIGARLLILAGHLGVKSVDFMGIDGFSGYIKGIHTFEDNKGRDFLPSSIKSLNDNDAKVAFMNEYRILKSTLEKFPTKYKNLGAGSPLNDIGTILDQ